VPITHPPILDTTYGRTPVEPICRLRFTLTGQTPVTVDVVDGTLRHDAGSWPRTELDATLPTTITPSLLPPALSAFGGRVRVTLGARIRGTEYAFTAATLAVAAVQITRPDAAVRVRAASFETVVNEDRYDVPVDNDAGDLRDVVAGIVRRSIPDVVVVDELGSVGSTIIPEGAYPLEGDVWPIIERIMDDYGAEAWFDELGRLRMRLVPVVSSTPDLVLAAGVSLTGYDSSRAWGPNRVALVYTTPGSSGSSRRHGWSTSTGVPGSGLIAANAEPNVATSLRINVTDLDGTNVGDAFAGLRGPDGLRPGDRVRIVDDDPALDKPTRIVYVVTGTATLAAGVWTVPVRVVRAVKAATTAGWIPNSKVVTITATIRPRRVVGIWEDTTATSPTRVSGPYGRHTFREDLAVERGELPTRADANAAARAMALRVVGRFRQVTASGIPAPWIIPGDTVRLGMLGGLTESHVVQAITHPLAGLEPLELTTRDASYTGGPF
jgi:hypothetical protein